MNKNVQKVFYWVSLVAFSVACQQEQKRNRSNRPSDEELVHPNYITEVIESVRSDSASRIVIDNSVVEFDEGTFAKDATVRLRRIDPSKIDSDSVVLGSIVSDVIQVEIYDAESDSYFTQDQLQKPYRIFQTVEEAAVAQSLTMMVVTNPGATDSTQTSLPVTLDPVALALTQAERTVSERFRLSYAWLWTVLKNDEIAGVSSAASGEFIFQPAPPKEVKKAGPAQSSSGGSSSNAISLTRVEPNRGSANGATLVTIIGSGFDAGVTVTIGTSPCQNIQIIGTTKLACQTTSGTVGTKSVSVSKESTSVNLDSAFTYLTPGWTAIAAVPASFSDEFGARYSSGVWTGTEFLIWGGSQAETHAAFENGGAAFNPLTNTWRRISSVGAPEERINHRAVWTGTRMLVWGGSNYLGSRLTNGGVYDPATDTWQSIASPELFGERDFPDVVWTGTEMIVWGGSLGFSMPAGNGAKFNPTTSTWTSVATLDSPTPRGRSTGIWTGTSLISWGGYKTPDYFKSGGIYSPITNSWQATADVGTASFARLNHTAIWTGGEMIVWGGEGLSSTYLNSGARYDPATNAWTMVSASSAPSGRAYHSAVWTGTRMIVWGGSIADSLAQGGGIYDPVANAWANVPTSNAPSDRIGHLNAWTGWGMIVWGGTNFALDGQPHGAILIP